MEKYKEKQKKNKNHFNISNYKLEDKNANLCKKYFYKPNLDQKHKNIFHELENGQNLDELEQVYNENIVFKKGKNQLLSKKINCIKSMILHHKDIPEKWIIKHNYRNILSKVMKDPIVLSYAIFSKDYYKQRSSSMSIDDDEIKRYLSLSPKEPKFISYINPYSRNFNESSKKHIIRKEYGYNLKKRKNKGQNIYILKTESNDIKRFNKNLYINIDIDKEQELPNIFGNAKEVGNTDDNKKTEDKNDLTMMTSLYYDENKLNERKQNDEKSKNYNIESKDKTIKKQKIELPMID